FFAYDAMGDVEIDRLPALRPPQGLEPFVVETKGAEDWMLDPTEEAAELARLESEAELHAPEEMRQRELAAAEGPIAGMDEVPSEEGAGGKKKRRRRRRRKGKGGGENGEPGDAQRAEPAEGASTAEGDEEGEHAAQAPAEGEGAPNGEKKR